jgi:molybdenum cofactor synthesis domain-containing protein
MTQNTKTAGLIIIGNEILSGRTQDKNTAYIAQKLEMIGVRLTEVRVIPDVIDTIIGTVRHFSEAFDYVFTTGGIGPTHDDKTAEAVAKAFDVKLLKNAEAYQILLNHYGDEAEMNDGRVKMAYTPEGASLIPNPVSSAPGFQINNVHVMAGVPKIMQSMLDYILPSLEGGDVIKSRQMVINQAESTIAPLIETLESDFKGIEVGSYPRYKNGEPEVTIIIRGTDETQVEQAFEMLEEKINKMSSRM